MTGATFEDYHASCIAEWVALLWEWPEDEMTTIEQYETRIAKDEKQITRYLADAERAVKDENRELYKKSAQSLEALTARHKAKLAELRGDGVGQLTIFDAA